jgi:two-component system chemotaxis sensor kinase CheA
MFYEEARELLIGLEEGLMDLERRRGDRAHLDKTFRAAHSLKGAAAMVGLAAISEFTHGIEAVLDRIRAGSLATNSDMITSLLEARDHLAAMVEAEAARSPIPPSAELAHRLGALLFGTDGPSRDAADAAGAGQAAVPPPGSPAAESQSPAGSKQEAPVARPPESTRKRAYKDSASAAAAGEPATRSAPDPGSPARGESRRPRAGPGTVDQAAAPLPEGVTAGRASRRKPRSPRRKTARLDQAPAPEEAGAPADGQALDEYRITLAPGPESLRRGINPLGVFDELRELGEATLTTDPEVVPLLDELDPERCYLSWTIVVRTAADPTRIREVFLFFGDDSTVTIERKSRSGRWVPVPAEVGGTKGVAAAATALGDGRAATVPTAPVASPSAAVAGSAKMGTVAPPPLVGPPVALPFLPGVSRPGVSPPPVPRAVARQGARIRVDAAQLDELVGLAGELAVLSDNLIGLRELKSQGIDHWLHALEALQRVSREIRDATLDLRMVPVDELFSRAPRMVRDLADRSGKEIELRIVGQETRLDRTIIERLNDPLVHLIRNAVDHALEHPDEREAKGKPRVGRITLSAGHEGDRVAIRVEDDGRGLDRDKIVRKGIALGMIAPGTSPDDPRVVSLIFEPGFSTRDSVSEVSGRGVGLDVVRDAVRALRGSVAVESAPGAGTAFIFRLPLTLALIDGLLVDAAGGTYVVPLAQVEECVALDANRSALAQGRPCVAVRGELVPVVFLRRLFRTDGAPPVRQELLLTRHAGQRVGVAVDRLLGRVQAVIQSLGEGLHGLNRFSGATILGDGSVSLILDLSALVSESRLAEQSARFSPSPGMGAESYR